MNSQLKVCHISSSDTGGGAARAAYRVHKSLVKNSEKINIHSFMRVINKISDDPDVISGPPNNNNLNYLFHKILNKFARSAYYSDNINFSSIAWPKTGLAKELNNMFYNKKLDIVNLHWLGSNTISIDEIGKLKMPVFWRLADQWAFCGCEHYTKLTDKNSNEKEDIQYIKGYKNFDLNTIMWKKKIKSWKSNINIVAPSNWIANCARKSFLFKNSKIKVIPTPLDLQKWAPLDMKMARSILNLPMDKALILFGAQGGLSDMRKGGGFFLQALQKLSSITSTNFEVVIFGQGNNRDQTNYPFKINYLGNLNDDVSIRLCYSACELFVISSIQDNLPGTALESHACGTPVVSFNVGGLADIIEDNITGSLVEPFNIEDLTQKIKLIIEDDFYRKKLSQNCRNRAEQLWNQDIISEMYNNFYRSILD